MISSQQHARCWPKQARSKGDPVGVAKSQLRMTALDSCLIEIGNELQPMNSGLMAEVAALTGGARRQGRSYAVRLAAEDVDIVVCDLVDQLPSGAISDVTGPGS